MAWPPFRPCPAAGPSDRERLGGVEEGKSGFAEDSGSFGSTQPGWPETSETPSTSGIPNGGMSSMFFNSSLTCSAVGESSGICSTFTPSISTTFGCESPLWSMSSGWSFCGVSTMSVPDVPPSSLGERSSPLEPTSPLPSGSFAGASGVVSPVRGDVSLIWSTCVRESSALGSSGTGSGFGVSLGAGSTGCSPP
ncbi:hypothetical protein ACFQX6_30980 [Streptosporangium lutulentum]